MAPLIIRETTGSNMMSIDTRFCTNQAHDKLLCRHLKTEKPDRNIIVNRSVSCDRKDKCGFPLRRSSGDYNKIRSLKTACKIIDLRETRRYSGYAAVFSMNTFEHLHRFEDGFLHCDEGFF